MDHGLDSLPNYLSYPEVIFVNLRPFGSEQVNQAKAGKAECQIGRGKHLTHMRHLITVLHIMQLLLRPKFTY